MDDIVKKAIACGAAKKALKHPLKDLYVDVTRGAANRTLKFSELDRIYDSWVLLQASSTRPRCRGGVAASANLEVGTVLEVRPVFRRGRRRLCPKLARQRRPTIRANMLLLSFAAAV
jgi:hypothetical protein